MSANPFAHENWLLAMRDCENSLDSVESRNVAQSLASMGYQGGEIYPGYMGMILSDVSPMKYDKALRDRLVKGYLEDTQ